MTLADKGGEGDAGRQRRNTPQTSFAFSPAQVCITPEEGMRKQQNTCNEGKKRKQKGKKLSYVMQMRIGRWLPKKKEITLHVQA